MAKFRQGDRVRVTNQQSESRNMLGAVVGYNTEGPEPLALVRLDGGGRYVHNPRLFAEQDLGETTHDDPTGLFAF